MAIGTLFGNEQTRSILPVGLVKAFGLDIDVADAKTDAHLAAFSNGLVPAFVGEKGFKISESIAILYYRMFYMRLHDEKFNLNSYPCLKPRVENSFT